MTKIAAITEIADSVAVDLNKRLPTKHLGGVIWYVGSECKRDREKGTLEISRTRFIRKIVEHFGATGTSSLQRFSVVEPQARE